MRKTESYSYRPDIDGIRAYAVIAVIINHFNNDILPSGYLGVDIFLLSLGLLSLLLWRGDQITVSVIFF